VLLEIECGTCGAFCRAALVGLVEHGLPHPVSRAQRSTSEAKWCAADPGPLRTPASGTVPGLHCVTSCRSAPGTSHHFGLFFCHSAITGLAWRKQSTPTGMPQ
jgi:hypothetical protein